MKILITTTRKPFLNGVGLSAGDEVEIEDPALAKKFLDNDFGVELVPEKKAEKAAKPAKPDEPVAGEEV